MARGHQIIGSTRQRNVGIATEQVSVFGRSILRGVIQYANLQPRWVLHTDRWRVAKRWPKCDGTIIGGLHPRFLADIRKHSRYLVGCSGSLDPTEMPVVRLNDDVTGAMAAQHLIERGFQNFGVFAPHSATVTSAATSVYARRVRGFSEKLREHGFSWVASSTQQSFEDYLTHAHHPRLIRWLRSFRQPTGIMAVDDTYAHDLTIACRTAKIQVPERVAIIGINNDDLLCNSAMPPLSSVECNFARMGYLAAKTLDRLMNGEKLKPDERLVQLLPIRVEQRVSTDVLAIDQPDVAEAVRYIREHACDPCSVHDLMAVIPVSRRKLERSFVERLGRSIHDEIVRVRIDSAQRLLNQSDLSIDEISRRCGFSAAESFYRFFLHATGNTPAAFRKQSLLGTSGPQRIEPDAIG